jgi:uncharacterized protein (TIGR03382 family)
MTPLPGGFPTAQTVDNAATVRISKQGLDFVEGNLGDIASTVMGAKDGALDLQIPKIPFAVPDAVLAFDVNGEICPDGPDPNQSPPRCVARARIEDSKFQIDSLTPNALRVKATIPLKLDDTPVKITDPFSGTIHVGYGSNTSCNEEKPVVSEKELPLTITIPIVAETVVPRVGYAKVDIDGATFDLSALVSDDVRMCATCGSFPSSFCNAILNWGYLKDKIVGSIKDSLDGQLKNALKGYLCTKPNPTLVPGCPLESGPDAERTYCVYDADPTKCVPSLLGTDAHVDLGGFLASFSPTTAGGLDFGIAAFGPMKPFPSLSPNATGRSENGITLGMVGGLAPQPPSKCVPQAPVTIPKDIPIPDELAPKTPDLPNTPHLGLALSGRFLEYAFTNVYNSGLLCLDITSEQSDLLKSGILSILIPSIRTLTFEQNDAAAAIATRPQKPPVVKIGGGTDPIEDPLLSLTLPSFALDVYVWSFDRFVRVFTYTSDLFVPIQLQTGKTDKNPDGGILPSIGAVSVTNGIVTNGDSLLLDSPETVAQSLTTIVGSLSQQLIGAGLPAVGLNSATASMGLDLQVSNIKKLHKDSDDFVALFASLSKAPPAKQGLIDTKPKMIAQDNGEHPFLELELGHDDGIEYSWWLDQGTHTAWTTSKTARIDGQALALQGKHVLHVTSRRVGDAPSEDPTPATFDFTIDRLAPIGRLVREDGALRVHAWDIVSAQVKARYRVDGGDFSAWQPASDVAVRSNGLVEVEVADESGNVARLSDGEKRSTTGCSAAPRSSGTGAFWVFGIVGIAAWLRRRRAVLALALLGCGSDDDAKTHCGNDCNQVCQSGLKIGQPGAFLSIAKDHSGQIWAAGYNDSLVADGATMPYGDLVAGKFDRAKQSVDWVTVDGVPARADNTCPSFAPTEWRGGETQAGDDVGRWTSMQVGAADQPLVTYYDDTHKRLKMAVFEDGAWKSFVLREQPGADAGRYAKMVLDDARPVVAFRQTEAGRSKIVIARATTSTPHSAGDFTFEDAAVNEVEPKIPVFDARPHGLGVGISLARGPKGLGLVAYDGDAGNLVGLFDHGKVPWERVIIDGQVGSEADKSAIDTGNAGAAASLFIDDSDVWHVSYVELTSQTLRYVEVHDGKPERPDVVDDGATVEGTTTARHLVGDDSQVRVANGQIEIVYTDSTTLGMKRAFGKGEAGARTWEAKAIAQPDGRWVAFPRYVPDDSLTLSWWRLGYADTRSVAGNVSALP